MMLCETTSGSSPRQTTRLCPQPYQFQKQTWQPQGLARRRSRNRRFTGHSSGSRRAAAGPCGAPLRQLGYTFGGERLGPRCLEGLTARRRTSSEAE